MDETLNCVPTRARPTIEMSRQLDAPFVAEEVKRALFKTCSTKALGPDALIFSSVTAMFVERRQ
jgi:hypothetical protein